MFSLKFKKSISAMLAVVTMLSLFSFAASAATMANAFDVPTSSKYAKVYTLATSGTTIPYTSKYLSTRGTTSGASKTAYIANASDELYLMDVGTTNGKTWAYVSYPVGTSRRNAYIYLSAISSAAYGKNHLYFSKALGKFYCSPRKGGKTSASYYVSKGDKVYVLTASATSGTYCQILYPISGNKWRMGWCTINDAEKYLNNTKVTYYTLTYNANGGSNAPAKQSVKANTEFSLSTAKPTRSGYTFLGWSTSKSATSATYKAGATVKLTKNITLYAVWKSNSYTGYVNTASAPLVLRKSASTSSAALANMPKGSVLTVLNGKTKTNGFYKVTYNGQTGYAAASYITFTKPQTATTTLIWPTSGKYVTCMYYYASGSKHSTRYGYKNAIDIAGGGNVYAAASGTIETVAYQSGGFGNYIVIKHTDGTRTLYAHLKSYCVKKGQSVTQGQTIGVMGSTGKSSGTHLHFEWSGGDPWALYFKSNNSLKYEYNVRSNNSKFNSDKTIVNWIDTYCKYSGGYYYYK